MVSRMKGLSSTCLCLQTMTVDKRLHVSYECPCQSEVPSQAYCFDLLYADDFIIMSTTAAGLQRQLDALQQFCHQRQLSVSLAKTNVVTYGSKAACQTAVKWSERSHTSILGLNFMQPKVWHTASHSLSLLQRKQCGPRSADAHFASS